MKKDILRFSLLSLVAVIPVIIIVITYLFIDPFRVITPTNPFFVPERPMYVGWNKSFVSTETFRNNHSTEHYDSYIFGPSLSIGYRVDDWKKYISPKSKIMHFDASAESLTGILLKLKYIVAHGERISNALFILDPHIFNRGDISGIHLYAQHPDLTPEPDLIQFHWKFFKLFINRDFLSAYIDLKLNGFQDYMQEKSIFTIEFPDYNGITNEEAYPFYDKILEKDENTFYAPRLKTFNRKYKTSKILKAYFTPQIVEQLKEIKKILAAQSTNYKIIFPPMYSLETLANSDKTIFYNIFGRENITDYSGANMLSMNIHSYYDAKSHPRPLTCAEILKETYKK